MTEELSEKCRVLFQNKFEILVHLVGFIIRTCSHCRQNPNLRDREGQMISKAPLRKTQLEDMGAYAIVILFSFI